MKKRRVIAYVDGFNFYYRRLRSKPYRWLNPVALFDLLFPNDYVIAVKYFTARVGGKFDAGKPARQDLYLRALGTIPRLQIIEGQFVTTTVRRPLATPMTDITGQIHEHVLIVDSDEKGSDVNLGSHLLNDAWEDAYDLAAVLTNDSDLAVPMKMARNRNKTIALINPHNNVSKKLIGCSSIMLHLEDNELHAAQLPETVTTQNGRVLRKPDAWCA
jgi:uncharacterized LabA/DUF88 family protein